MELQKNLDQEKTDSVVVTRLLFDGRWLISSFKTPKDILKFIGQESLNKSGIPTVYWPSDLNAYMPWTKEMSEANKAKDLPVNRRR